MLICLTSLISIMASQKEMYEIIGRAVAHQDFRNELIKNPEKAVQGLGYALTPEQAKALHDADLSAIGEELSRMVSKMSIACGALGLGW
jgi:hypothetical protein